MSLSNLSIISISCLDTALILPRNCLDTALYQDDFDNKEARSVILTIIAIGDSHSFFWSGRDDFASTRTDDDTFHVFHCGPTIAYQTAKIRTSLDTTIDQWLDDHVHLYSHAIFCFGEIDCRAHFVKQSELQNRSIENIIDDTVDRYFDVICGIRDKYNLACLVQGVPPGPDDIIAKSLPYPCIGTSEQRNRAAIYFNQQLSDRSLREENIAFFSILDTLLTDDLTPVPGCTYDGQHLSQSVRPLMDQALAEAIASLKA